MQRNSSTISKNLKENLLKTVLLSTKSKSNLFCYPRLKKNNIFNQIYDKMNNPDRIDESHVQKNMKSRI